MKLKSTLQHGTMLLAAAVMVACGGNDKKKEVQAKPAEPVVDTHPEDAL